MHQNRLAPAFPALVITACMIVALPLAACSGPTTTFSRGPEPTVSTASTASTTSGISQPTASPTPSATTARPSASPTPAPTGKPAASPTPKPTAAATTSSAALTPVTPEYRAMMKRDLLVLLTAYPDLFSGIEARDSQVWLVTRAGGRLLYDDRKVKTYAERQSSADLQDSLEQIYPLRTVTTLMPANFDPGRFRCYPLFNALYGSSESARYAKLIRVPFGTQNLLFSSAAGGAASLGTAARRVADLVAAQPAVGTYAYPSSGTWNSRNIAGTTLLSAHGYGIAIDLHANADDYWINATAKAGAARLAGYPAELTRCLEDNGFIWGGKWNHFDIMHYEYRPEIILKARWFPGAVDLSRPWQQGADTGSAAVAANITLIDSKLG